MQELKLDEATARRLYTDASPLEKAILEATFNFSATKPRKQYHEIVTLNDVFEATGADPKDPKFHDAEPNVIALRHIELIALALNPPGWKADYNDDDQYKYYPVFWMDSPGFRFDGSHYATTDSYSSGGSRTVFASSEISDHAGKTFLSVYKQFHE